MTAPRSLRAAFLWNLAEVLDGISCRLEAWAINLRWRCMGVIASTPRTPAEGTNPFLALVEQHQEEARGRIAAVRTRIALRRNRR